jgi:hypothetical protein
MAWRQVTNSSDGNDFTYWQDDKTGEMTFTDPTPGVDDAAAYDDARYRQVWNSTPGDVQAKLNATAELTGAGIAQIAPWAQKAGLATNADLQANLGIQQLAARGYSLREDGQINDPMSSEGDKWRGLMPVILGAAGFAGAAAAGAGAAGTASGVGTAEAAGALGGAAGTSGGGLTLAEAAGVTGAAGTAAGTTGGMIGTEAALNAGTGATTAGTVGAEGGGLGGATTGGAAMTGGGSALSRLTGIDSDYLQLGGTALATGLGLYGSNQQAGALNDLADKYMAIGAPSRARYEATFAPDFKPQDIPGYQGAIDTSMQSLLRQISARDGNPWGSPGGTTEALKYVTGNVGLPAIQNYRNQLAATGGYNAFNTAAPGAAAGAVGAQGNTYNVLGAGIADLTQPRQRYSLSDMYRSLA